MLVRSWAVALVIKGERERENVNWLSVGATNKSHSIIEATWHAN